MFFKTSTVVAVALLAAAALCGSASAEHGRHLLTCPTPVHCEEPCDPTLTCTPLCACPDYHCNEHTLKCELKCPKPPGPKPPVPEEDTCQGPETKPNGDRLYKVCAASGPGNPTSTNCGVGCYENCAAACEAVQSELKDEYAMGVPSNFCNNFPGGNCKGEDPTLQGPCCGCKIDLACKEPVVFE